MQVVAWRGSACSRRSWWSCSSSLPQLVGITFGAVNQLMWLPMLAFEVSLALWLIFKGAAMPGRSLSEA